MAKLLAAGFDIKEEKTMKSKPYKLHGKLFRYDFDRSVVERIYKAGKEEVANNEEWMQKYGKPLFDIDADSYVVITTVGLHVDNWKNKAARDEYLYEWCVDLDEENAALAADYEKYEFPHMNGGN